MSIPDSCECRIKCSTHEAAGELLEALKALRETVTHDCWDSERVHMLEHFAPAVLAASDAIERAEGGSRSCVNQGQHCEHDECCVCGAHAEGK